MQAGIRLYKCENTVDVLESPLVQNMGQLGYEHGLKYGSCHYYVDRKRDNEKMTVETTTKDPIFNRIYGVSFSTKELRKNYVVYLASLAKINHRAISRTQDLFLVHKTSPGSPIFLPAGTRLFNRLVQLMRSKYEEYEFQEIITPLMFNKELWETSGHWENYKNDMYAVVDANPNDTAGPAVPEVGLKPMNCPSHCLVYKSAPKSANDLPLRYADFTALHRNEPSGTLVGLTRVRKFHQDDGHIFCSFDDIGKEISKQLQMIAEVYSILRFDNYSLSLSTRPEKHIGTSDTWDRAESLLKTALDTSGIAYDIKHGDGAFYGPKIDIDVRDAYGRRHQTATIQLDFQLPERFNLYYSNADGSAKSRPVIIHRAVLGSLERMMALLIEYYEGRWPFWISPRQAIVIPTIDDSTSVKDKGIILEYADTVKRLLSGGSNSVKYLDRLYPATNTGVNSNISSQPNQNNPDTTSIRMKNYSFHVDFEKNYHQPTYKIKNRAKELNYNYHITVGLDNAQNKTINVKNYIENKNLGTIQIKDLQQEFMNKMDHYK
ncbi:putative threonine-tRNA ligase, mitochondrial [Zancudomyces culisetae]|uniref:threonine--tRNA ligase n=1 Tax=Zancudomyces culisetae TaxID=1213189 RepID=A0A1R1PYM9_ZANCU|nr:putative threonine-tRNA ligase, mitochondrial [Zancudomyces culisetae]|eukprot:OMH86063.1 putative threonine-tRNA ligase, mitochondrial [Zancudomyces culisetae]